MVRGSQDILSWFESSNMPYWRIYAHKGIVSGNVIMQSDNKEGQSHGDALADLRQKLRVLNRGTFTLAAFPNPDRLPTKGYWFTDIEITQGDAQPAAVVGIGVPAGMSETDVQKRIDDALTKYKTEQELADLKKKTVELEKAKKELEKSVNEPWNKVIGALAPHADKIIAGIFPQTAQVAGMPAPDPEPDDNIELTEVEVIEPEETALTVDQQSVLSDFVTTLAANDADWIDTLKRLTKAINDKPSMISMVKNFI
jgi:hypothetical protein